MSQSGCKTTQMLKEFSCSPRELITSTEQTLLATGGKEKSEQGWSYSSIPFSFSSPSSQCASKALCSQRQRPCHAVYNSPWMGKCVNSKTLSSLGNSKCVEEHLGCVPQEEAAGGSGKTCLQVYEGLLLLHSSGLPCSFPAPYLTWAFDLLLWERQHFKDASEPSPSFPTWGLSHHTFSVLAPKPLTSTRVSAGHTLTSP